VWVASRREVGKIPQRRGRAKDRVRRYIYQALASSELASVLGTMDSSSPESRQALADARVAPTEVSVERVYREAAGCP
jgi:hypothetical protein